MPRLESSALFKAGKVLKVLRRNLGADDIRILLHHGVGLIHGLAAQELSAQGGDEANAVMEKYADVVRAQIAP